MRHDDTLQLLAVCGQSAVVERLSAALRARSPLHVERVSSAERLRRHLGESAWLALACFEEEGQELAPAQVLRLWEESGRRLPLLLVQAPQSREDAGQWYERGAADVLPAAAADRLSWRLLRELEGERQRRAARLQELALGELRQRVRRLLDASSEAVACLRDGRHLYCNAAYAALFGQPDVAGVGSLSLLELVAPADRPALRRALAASRQGERRLTLRARQPAGEGQPLLLRLRPADFEGEPCLELSVQPANSSAAPVPAEQAELDLLTRLCRPATFQRHVEAAIAAALREGQDSMLLLLRLQQFPDLASGLGRTQANRILADISDLLRGTRRKGFCAARLGPDEFGLLLPGAAPDEALRTAEGMRARIEGRLAEDRVPGLAPAGVAIAAAQINRHTRHADDCLARARHDLEASLLPDGHYLAGSEGLDGLLAYLDEALAQARLKLLFQPVVPLQGSRSGQGYELFSRLLDSAGNELPPATFLPALALAGRGEDFDRLLCERALAELARDRGGRATLALKLSPGSLLGRAFLPWLSDILRRGDSPAERLLFQISEADLQRNPEAVLTFCEGLGELGLRRSLIHFGLAPDPFRHVAALAPWSVVLDASLLRDISYGLEQRERLRALVDDLHRLGCRIGAARVEDLELLALLCELGVDTAQGFCLQAPSPAMNYEFVQETEITQVAVAAL